MVQLVIAVLFTALFSIGPSVHAAAASPTCKHDSTTAKSLLSALYSAERAFHSEHKTYSDSFGDIGFDPNVEAFDDTNCDNTNWNFEISQIQGTDQFTATAFSRVTREEYTINEKKEIRKVGLEVSSAPTEE